jgi:hypothetical protein
MSKHSLPVVVANAETATFDCIFGHGCEGICCKSGRPSVNDAEQARILKQLPRILPLLRPEARAVIETDGIISNRIKLGQPMVRVAAGWCVFFNSGCVLHTLGAEDGDTFAYKPTQCALFPLEFDEERRDWFIRQWGYRNDQWDLFCLNPQASPKPAVDSLAGELTLAARCDREMGRNGSRSDVDAVPEHESCR